MYMGDGGVGVGVGVGAQGSTPLTTESKNKPRGKYTKDPRPKLL